MKCDELRAKVEELGKELAALTAAPKANEKTIEDLELQVASEVNAIAHLMTLVKNYRSNCLRVPAENEELRRTVDHMEGKHL